MKLDHIDWSGPEPIAVFNLGFGRGCVEPMTQNMTVKDMEGEIRRGHYSSRYYKQALAEIVREIEPNSITSRAKVGEPSVEARNLDWGTW